MSNTPLLPIHSGRSSAWTPLASPTVKMSVPSWTWLLNSWRKSSMPSVLAVMSCTLTVPSLLSGVPSEKSAGFLMYGMASMRKPPAPLSTQYRAMSISAWRTAGFSQFRSGWEAAKVCM